jgi:hypothetical protein
MKAQKHTFTVIALIMAVTMGISTRTAYAGSMTVEDLAGKWVTVQLVIIPSAGLSSGKGGLVLPGGSAISSASLWTFHADGTCDLKSFSNFDGQSVDLVEFPPESFVCTITLEVDGTGLIDVAGPGGATVFKIVVINNNKIAATTSESVVSAFMFERQVLNGDEDEGRRRRKR